MAAFADDDSEGADAEQDGAGGRLGDGREGEDAGGFAEGEQAVVEVHRPVAAARRETAKADDSANRERRRCFMAG